MHIVMKSDNNENNIYYIGYKNKIIKVLNFIFNPVMGHLFVEIYTRLGGVTTTVMYMPDI